MIVLVIELVFYLVQRLYFWPHSQGAEVSEHPAYVFGLEGQEKLSYSDRVTFCQRKPPVGMQETCPPTCSSFGPCASWLVHPLPLLFLPLGHREVCQDEVLYFKKTKVVLQRFGDL